MLRFAPRVFICFVGILENSEVLPIQHKLTGIYN